MVHIRNSKLSKTFKVVKDIQSCQRHSKLSKTFKVVKDIQSCQIHSKLSKTFTSFTIQSNKKY